MVRKDIKSEIYMIIEREDDDDEITRSCISKTQRFELIRFPALDYIVEIMKLKVYISYD